MVPVVENHICRRSFLAVKLGFSDGCLKKRFRILNDFLGNHAETKRSCLKVMVRQRDRCLEKGTAGGVVGKGGDVNPKEPFERSYVSENGGSRRYSVHTRFTSWAMSCAQSRLCSEAQQKINSRLGITIISR